jgi:NAD(P)H-dependent FMN reductase
LFDEDLEEREGVPETARRLKELFCAHQGLLIASPEYNSSISGVLKNAIDWLSRPMDGGLDALGCFKGKVLCLMSASTGRLGGLRGLAHVRAILGNLGVIVLPDQVAVPNADEAFNPDDSFRNAAQQASVEQLGSEVVSVVSRLYGKKAV